MERHRGEPRPGWEKTVEGQGLVYGIPGRGQGGSPRPYWDESVHYVFEMDEVLARSSDVPAEEPEFFPADTMRFLHEQQVRCVEHVDGLVGELFTKCPPNTHFIITADHGELFGEDDYFGHGPVMHRKCFEVPFVEGLRP